MKVSIKEKAGTYIRYFGHSALRLDFNWMINGVVYILAGRPPKRDMYVNQGMGKIYCRAHTTDFMYANRGYEYKIKRLISNSLSCFDLFIEVGACVGEYSVWMAKNGKSCIAIEPVEDNFKSLTKNLALNGLEERVTTVKAALSDHLGTAEFAIRTVNKGASGLASLFAPGTGVSERVPLTTLDILLEQLNLSFDSGVVIKIDAEHMEEWVLKGGLKSLGQIPRLMVVYETAHLKNRRSLEYIFDEVGEFNHSYVDCLNSLAVKKAFYL